MRRNRQKLHRELRLKAEAQQRRRRQQRLHKKAARAAAISRAESALRTRASASRPVPADAVLRSIRELLRLAEVTSTTARRVVRVYGAVRDQVPELARVEQLPWFCLLAAPAWLRTPERWTPPSGSLAKKRDHFARHLLTRYPVPAFLLRALDVDPLAVARVPVEDHWAVNLLAHVGRGDSLRAMVGTERMPAPLTRKMQHLLLGAKATLTPVAALRRAQVEGIGGPSTLWRTLLRTRLGGLRGADALVGEPFWHDIIGWLVRKPATHELSALELDELLGWCELRVRRDGSLSMKGRTVASIRREIGELRLAHARSSGDAFPQSGLLPIELNNWSIDEIRTPTELQEDSSELKNCAWQYRNLIRKRKVALFRLSRDGLRQAMIEVSLGAARVVQARRVCNAALNAADRQVVLNWARLNRLQATF